MKKIILSLLISVSIVSTSACAMEKTVEKLVDEEAQQQMVMYPSPMTESEKKEICQLVKDGKYEEIPSVTYQEAGINEKDFNKKLIEAKLGYTESIDRENKLVTVTDYNNDGIEDKLVRVIYDRSGGNGGVWIYFLEFKNGGLFPIIYSRRNGNLFFWRSAVPYEKTYEYPYSGGQHIIKVNGKNYLATLDRDPYFDKINQVRPRGKYRRTIERVDLIKTYPDGKNINHIVCEL